MAGHSAVLTNTSSMAMASCTSLKQFAYLVNPNFPSIRSKHPVMVRCASKPEEFPPPSQTTIPAESFPLEKRRKSEIIRRRKSELAKSEPPNYEIGWKRTKKTQVEKPVGYVIMDFLEKLEELMGRGEFGSVALLAKVGEVVAERAREEADLLMEEGKVDERMVTELSRVLKLMEMDLAMVSAAVKDETFIQRLQIAQSRCRQAILVAASF